MICAKKFLNVRSSLYIVKIAFFSHKFANQMSMVLKVFPVTLARNGNLFAPQAKNFSLNIVQEISKRFLIVRMRLSSFSHHRNTGF